MRSLIGGVDCPPFIGEWINAFQLECPPSELDCLHVAQFANHSADICAKVRQAIVSDSLDSLPWTVQQLWDEVLGLQSVLESAQPQISPFEAPVSVKSHIQNRYRTCYTRTLQFMYQLLESDLPMQDLTIDTATCNHIRSQITAIIQSLAAATIHTAERVLAPDTNMSDPTLSSMPDWFDILKILWPLRILCACKQILLPSQVETVEAMLQRINDDFCIRQAVAPHGLSESSDFHIE